MTKTSKSSLTKEKIWQIINLYASGHSYRKIEKQVGISTYTISMVLNANPPYTAHARSCPEFRAAWERVWKMRHDTPYYEVHEVAKIMRLYVDDWMTQRQIGERMGVSQNSIARVLHLKGHYGIYKDSLPAPLLKRVRKKLKGMKGGRCSSKKLTPIQVQEIREEISKGEYKNFDELGQKYGISGSTVSGIHRGEIWKDI